MGNKIGKRRHVVDDMFTRPQGLYHHRDIDHKKLRRLILDSKLAPCYLGEEECTADLEECPICFLYYPSLNRSRCCMKGICTECFLQMKPPNSSRPTQCPFCKTPNYAVEYRGMRTKEEKGMEQIEEQKVIEAKIRMWQQALQDEEERMQKKQERLSSSRIVTPAIAECQDIPDNTLSGWLHTSCCSHLFATLCDSFTNLQVLGVAPRTTVPSLPVPSMHEDELVSSQASCSLPSSRRPFHSRQNREDNFDLDLEEIMVMEAIWLSIQDQGADRNPACGRSCGPGPSSSGDGYNSQAAVLTEASSSGGLACAAAALAEHQHMKGESANVASNNAPVFNMLRHSGSMPAGEETLTSNYPPESWMEASTDSRRAALEEDGALEDGELATPESARAVRREGSEWATDYGSEVAEAGTSNASSDGTLDAGATVSLPENVGAAGGHILTESFEEQMMLAMAVSLAEAQPRTDAPGVTWL